MSTAPEYTEPLNPGGILADSIGIIVRAPLSIGMAALIPMAVSGLISLLVLGVGFPSAGVGGDLTEPGDLLNVFVGTLGLAAIVVGLVGFSAVVVLSGAVARATIDHVNGAPISVAVALGTGVRYFFPLLLISVLVAICAYLGMLLLFLPGLYIMAMWWLVVPAVIDEGAGLSALGRSFELTAGYRWPMVGLVLLYALISIIAGALATIPEIMFGVMGMLGAALSTIVDIFVTAFAYGLAVVTSVLAFNRLRQIKEGGGQGVADIFT